MAKQNQTTEVCSGHNVIVLCNISEGLIPEQQVGQPEESLVDSRTPELGAGDPDDKRQDAGHPEIASDRTEERKTIEVAWAEPAEQLGGGR